MKDSKVNLILGVCGCVQAEQSPDFLQKLLERLDLNVEIVCTPNAPKFVDLAKLEKLSGKKVFMAHMDQSERFEVPHIQLGEWADLCVVYPASANTIAKMAHGFCDNLLLNVLMTLVPEKKVVFGPCMNDKMYLNPIVQQNIGILEKLDVSFVPRVQHPVYIHAQKKTVIKDYCSVDSALLTTLKAIVALEKSETTEN